MSDAAWSHSQSTRRTTLYSLARQNVFISFEDVGKGAPPVVLVHDLGCDHASFTPQIDYFRSDHRVVAVDLRGHGESDKPESQYSVESLADDIGWLCYELGLYAPVLVGHGLGGMVALDLAARYPALPGAVVVLNSLLLPPSDTVSFFHNFTTYINTLSDNAYEAALRRYVGCRFAPEGPMVHRPTVMRAVSAVPRQAAASAWRYTLSWDGGAAAAACRVPILYFDAGTGASELERLEEICDQVTIQHAICEGHFSHLQYPGRVNEMIEVFMRQSRKEADGSKSRPGTDDMNAIPRLGELGDSIGSRF